jgi:hypothetical protein
VKLVDIALVGPELIVIVPESGRVHDDCDRASGLAGIRSDE